MVRRRRRKKRRHEILTVSTDLKYGQIANVWRETASGKYHFATQLNPNKFAVDIDLSALTHRVRSTVRVWYEIWEDIYVHVKGRVRLHTKKVSEYSEKPKIRIVYD